KTQMMRSRFGRWPKPSSRLERRKTWTNLCGCGAPNRPSWKHAGKRRRRYSLQAGISNALNNGGLAHYRQGDYAQALECLQKSLTLREALGDQPGIAGTLN